jgi:hypothetical protein
MLFTRRLLLCILCFATLTATAQHEAMRWFAGTWHFEGRLTGNTSGAPDFTATWIVEQGLPDAFCLVGHVERETGTFTRETIMHDPVQQLYVRTIAVNDGSLYTFTTPGWENGRLTWTGARHAASGTTVMKEEIVRRSADEFRAVFFQQVDGVWAEVQTETLLRLPAKP